MSPHLQLFARAYQHFPIRLIQPGQQKYLHMGSRILKTMKPGRNDPGIIKDQQIIRP